LDELKEAQLSCREISSPPSPYSQVSSRLLHLTAQGFAIMACPKVAEALSQVMVSSDRGAALESMLDNIKSLSSPATVSADLNAILDALFSSSLGVVGTRAVLAHFITVLRALGNKDLWVEVGKHVLLRISESTSTSSSLLEQAAHIRELIATAHEDNEEFAEAARVLAEIPLDSSQRRVPDADKAKIWIRIVRDYLEVDDSTAAEAYLNKLKNVMHTIDDAELQLHFRLSAARIQDSKRQFLAAAQSYHEISFSPAIAEEERLHTLAMAIKCAVLAPAGPLRSRVLGRLYKDERSAGLDEFGILEKMFLDRLLAPQEVAKFAQGLQSHQLATTADGSTVLAKAVIEHNLLGVSRLYNNIGLDALALLLGLDGDKAEDTTSRMIEQGRLAGRIDQIDRIIWFDGVGGSNISGEAPSAAGEKGGNNNNTVVIGGSRSELAAGKEIRRWDANVQALAEELEQLTDALHAEFPVCVPPLLPLRMLPYLYKAWMKPWTNHQIFCDIGIRGGAVNSIDNAIPANMVTPPYLAMEAYHLEILCLPLWIRSVDEQCPWTAIEESRAKI
jgi:COP9 signalosome complex subunit 4